MYKPKTFENCTTWLIWVCKKLLALLIKIHIPWFLPSCITFFTYPRLFGLVNLALGINHNSGRWEKMGLAHNSQGWGCMSWCAIETGEGMNNDQWTMFSEHTSERWPRFRENNFWGNFLFSSFFVHVGISTSDWRLLKESPRGLFLQQITPFTPNIRRYREKNIGKHRKQ